MGNTDTTGVNSEARLRDFGLPGVDERRCCPRVQVAGLLQVADDHGTHPLLDISAKGLSFLSTDLPELEDGVATLTLHEAFHMQVAMLAADALHDAGEPPLYRIRCRFAQPTHGEIYAGLASELLQPV